MNSEGATPCSAFPPAIELRALIEGQFLAKLNHATKLGFTITQSTRVLATGGASANIRILQVEHTHTHTLTHTFFPMLIHLFIYVTQAIQTAL